ncbi:glycoside hydrolase family 9 protein [Lacipirellula sp.]|uniref:glycoside hydrolase family 9 protein n=1 Tax=Lacipirellula sp. TaxID=2691419 RepID=UPI003D11B69A
MPGLRWLCSTWCLLAVLAAHTAADDQAAPPTAPSIRLNTIGYLPGKPMVATIATATADGGKYQIRRLHDGAMVWEGDLPTPKANVDTDEKLTIADFTKLAPAAGEYEIILVNSGERTRFRVAEDLYHEPFRVATRAMYLWRCGMPVSGDHQGAHFEHGPCHLEDAYLDHVGGGHVQRASVGGWHDAGDYNKYVVNAAATVGMMFRAWEDFGPAIEQNKLDIPPTDPKLPEFLAEIKWELDWLLTMQADNGSVYHKVSALNFGGLIASDRDSDARYLAPWSSAATAAFTATMAQAARLYKPYDATFAKQCREAALRSAKFLREHPEEHEADQSAFNTGGYHAPDGDDRLWAAAEVWETTGDSDAFADLEERLAAHPNFDVDWDWQHLKNLGLITYLFSERDGRNPKLVKQLRKGLVAAADETVAAAANHGYARPFTKYYWGCNGTVARQAIGLEAAYRLTGNEAYRHATLDGLNHLFGRNCFGRSFVTGLGGQPPLFPHDRQSAGDAVASPWPGYLVGGPNPKATDWSDATEDYRTNEIAINWNGALIYALASQLPPVDGAASPR